MDEAANLDLPSAVVQRADCAERVVVLEIRVPGRTAHVVIAATSTGAGAGLLPRAPRQELWGGRLPPGSARQKAREKALDLARVVAVHGAEVFFEPHVADDDPEAAARIITRVLRVQGGRVVVTDAPVPAGPRGFVDVLADDDERVALEERGIAIARQLADDSIELYRVELVRMLEKARQKIDRRRAAIREDLTKIAQADKIAAQAQWLVGEAARVPRGATKLVVTDWSTGEAVPMEVPLDPSKGAREQVEAMFKRAKRLKLGARIAEGRLSQADVQATAVVDAIGAIRAAPSLVAMDAAAKDAKKSAPRDVALPGATGASGPSKDTSARGAKNEKAGKGEKGARRVPFRAFVARSGKKILVGKTALDNDTLTLKIAKPHDLWLHAKDRTGSHVIVQLEKGQNCPAEDLVDAAHLAAHFSDARDEKAVDVQYTPKRYLRKPKGSAAGLVVVDREKVLPLRFDAALLRALLEREEV